ncbi:MAG: DNA alkylation repair protein [Bacteroidales bacterium]
MDDIKRRQIKSCFRQAMNADLSNSMRDRGLVYKMNFGVPSPRIKLIADQFEPNAEDATYLWKEDVRESKILATYLFPKQEMTADLANRWCEEIVYPEIADQICMNLFAHLPFASTLAMNWIGTEKEIVRYTGLRLWVRLMQQQIMPDSSQRKQLLVVLKSALLCDNAYLCQVATSFVDKASDISQEWQKELSACFHDWKTASDEKLQQLYQYLCYWDQAEAQ